MVELQQAQATVQNGLQTGLNVVQEKLHQLEQYISEKVFKGWTPADMPNLAGRFTAGVSNGATASHAMQDQNQDWSKPDDK
jgi:hypothetical protein